MTKSPAQQQVRAEREWQGAIAALNHLLQDLLPEPPTTGEQSGAAEVSPVAVKAVSGLVLSGTAPVLDQLELVTRFATWTFTVGMPSEMLQLLPAANSEISPWAATPTLPLLHRDPLATEQFCLVLTAEFSLVMVLGETLDGIPAFLFSFEPDVLWQAWHALQARLKLAAPQALEPLNQLIDRFPPVDPHYRTVAQFTRQMLMHMPDASDWSNRPGQVFQGAAVALAETSAAASPTDTRSPGYQPSRSSRQTAQPLSASKSGRDWSAGSEPSFDTELLQAIAHEVRTPLTTIRTLTHLLLKRKDLKPEVIKRLDIIDRECREQIDRFNLIFRAVELETTTSKSALMPLAPISLAQVIQQNVARWQQQATQHSHTLDVAIPQTLPMVVTDPTMLDQALTGLIDRITHSLPPGSHIQVRVSLAGHQLKLQFESHPQPHSDGKARFDFAPALKSIGQLLMFQPETGNLSLNMAVTKNIFQAIGGKLIVRQRPQQGEVLTIFLPLATRRQEE